MSTGAAAQELIYSQYSTFAAEKIARNGKADVRFWG